MNEVSGHQKSNALQQPRTGAASGILQRKCASCGTHTVAGGKCDECDDKAGVLQRKSSNNSGHTEVPPIVHEVLNSPGRPLDKSTREFFEPRFARSFSSVPVSSLPQQMSRGSLTVSEPSDVFEQEADRVASSVIHSSLSTKRARNDKLDLSRVRIHTDARAAESALAINAHAYTLGNNIVFGAGQYEPQTHRGKQLLAHEMTHVIQQGGSHIFKGNNNKCLPISGRASTSNIQRREIGSGLDDPLYMADRRWSSGQGPDDRVTGRRLHNWAIARGSFVIRNDETLKRMQEKDGVESEIVNDIQLLLVDLLWGHNPRNRFDTAHTLLETAQQRGRNEAERTRLDKFEGSDNARGAAVLELHDIWGPIEAYFTGALMRRYRDDYLDAVSRTPKDMNLETNTEEIIRIRERRLYRHVHKIPISLGATQEFRIGERYGRLHIADIYNSLAGGTVWAYVDRHPLWYYTGGVAILNRNAVIGEVARSTAESAQFAGRLFPYLIKMGGFALSFSPNPLVMIAGVVLEQLGEEGLRDLNGEGRSFKDIASSAGQEILVDLILGKIMGGGGKSKGSSLAEEALEKVADKAAIRIRASVEKEIVRSEGSMVTNAVKAGEFRIVKERKFLDEGFTYEVKIKHDGGEHMYRMKKDGEWCRWSTRRLCDIDIPGIRKVHADSIRDRQVLEETGMKEVTSVPGRAPVESGVKGTLGEASHATEVTNRIPKKPNELLSDAEILKERAALHRGDITLRELVEKYPPEGAAQVFFPTARGNGRYIDHMYLESGTNFVVFRESKNYAEFGLNSKEIGQLQKDLAFLTHPRFKGVRIEWRISGSIAPDTLAIFDKLQRDTKGMFRYELDPVAP